MLIIYRSKTKTVMASDVRKAGVKALAEDKGLTVEQLAGTEF